MHMPQTVTQGQFKRYFFCPCCDMAEDILLALRVSLLFSSLSVATSASSSAFASCLPSSWHPQLSALCCLGPMMLVTPVCVAEGHLRAWGQEPFLTQRNCRLCCVASLPGIFKHDGVFLVCLLFCVSGYRPASDKDGGKLSISNDRHP